MIELPNNQGPYNEGVSDIKVQRALERGFIRPEDSGVRLAIGLETMHEAPLNALGQYALAETTTVVERTSVDA